MELTFWGVRGSYPISRPDNQRYGGNSTCIEVRHRSGAHVIIDGGSGIASLGRKLMDGPFGRGAGRCSVLFGHTHWDHILGFPFFQPLHAQGNRFEIYSAGQGPTDIESILGGQQAVDNFPVQLDTISADLGFHEIVPQRPLRVGALAVVPIQLNHPGMTLGFRIEPEGEPGNAVVIFTDTARIQVVQQGDGMESSPDFIDAYAAAIERHCRDAAVLIHDAQFDDLSIQGREHWGHSTAGDAVALAAAAKVEHVVLFHHSPEHSDDHVDRMLADARARAPHGLRVSAATEGHSIGAGDGP